MTTAIHQDKKTLPVTYFSQRDNATSPNISCFPTSMAMCVDYLLQRRGKTWKDITPDGLQLEDHINKLIDDTTTSEWLSDQVKTHGRWILTTTRRTIYIVEAFVFNRIMIDFAFQAIYKSISFNDLRSQIDRDIPLAIGGNFKATSHVGGHVVCAVGYAQKSRSIICNDPFGNALLGYPRRGDLPKYDDDGRMVEYPLSYFNGGQSFSSIWIMDISS